MFYVLLNSILNTVHVFPFSLTSKLHEEDKYSVKNVREIKLKTVHICWAN